ncbi:MAG: hypothetical protein ABIC68_06690 [Candidatus Omnitrophota bacterium]
MKRKSRVFVLVAMVAIVLITARGVFMKYNYTRYEGKDLSFEYPYGWQIRESKGRAEKYSQVHVFGPPEKTTGFRPSITVTAYPKQKSAGEFASSSDFSELYLARAKKLRGYKLESDKIVHLPSKLLSRDISMSYFLMLPLYKSNAKEVLMRSHVLFFERGSKIYVLGYKNAASCYATGNSAFTRVIKTLGFKT